MSQPLTSTRQRVPRQTAPLSILRTETVLSRFPIHSLAKRGRVAIAIRRTNAQGALDLRWDVSYNERYGPPRQLAYKLDTIVINQILDALPRPLPRVIPVGSLTHTCGMLDLNDSGRQQADLKKAFHQNASAYIIAYLRYRGRDGTERMLNTGFTRYSVIFTGERLPDGTIADAVYLALNEVYLDILNHAPTRPLDYAYLKILTPMAQRFYELLSYKMFAALKYRLPTATLRYGDYCLLATQHRYTDAVQMQKQMYKLHRPHLQSSYFTQVQYAATTNVDGQPDWLLHYTPGPKARAEYAAFTRQPDADAAVRGLPAEADQEDLVATRLRAVPEVPAPPVPADYQPPVAARGTPAVAHPLPCATMLPDLPCAAAPADPLLAQAHALISAFYQRFYGLTQVTPSPKELAHATELLTTHGEAKAHFLLAFAHQEAPETRYKPEVFGGILHYLPRALATYETRATPATTQQAGAATRRWQEHYEQWRKDAVAQLRAALPAVDLAALEAEHHARLVAEGKPAFTLRMGVRAAVDAVLEARAGLPSFAVWRQQQEA